MVGVPGRSKGCHTCRKRKIGCSLEKPHCAQCVKSRRICGGYQRDRIFVNHAASAKGTAVPAKAVIKAPVTGAKAAEPCITDKQLKPIEQITSLALDTNVHWSVSHELSSLSSYRQQLIGTFLSYHAQEKRRGAIEEKSWFVLLSELSFPTAAVERTMLAICAARLGRIHDDQVLVRNGLKLYTEGLHELQKALYDPHLMYKDETLGACLALASYEIMECPAGNRYAYASHRDGCAKLIQLRGAAAHTSGLGHQMFVSFRLQAIMNDLEHHHPTYLSEVSWLRIPWKDNPKTRFDQLLDIVCEAPAIFGRADEFDALAPEQKLFAARAVVNECWRVDGTLQTFYKELEAAYFGPLYWPEISNKSGIVDSDNIALFPTAYHFPDIQTAKTLVLYWAVLTMLWTGMTRLYHLMGVLQEAILSTYDLDPLPQLGSRAEFITPARYVLQSVEYLMQDKMLGLGPQSVVAPVAIVVDTIRDFPQYSRETSWAMAILDEIRGRGMQLLGCRGSQ